MNQTTKPKTPSWDDQSLSEKVGSVIGVIIVGIAVMALAWLVFGSIQPDETCYACEARDQRDYGANEEWGR